MGCFLLLLLGEGGGGVKLLFPPPYISNSENRVGCWISWQGSYLGYPDTGYIKSRISGPFVHWRSHSCSKIIFFLEQSVVIDCLSVLTYQLHPFSSSIMDSACFPYDICQTQSLPFPRLIETKQLANTTDHTWLLLY